MLFDEKGQTSKEIFDFIEDAVGKSESVLVHSSRGQSRSACVLASYIMKKFRWSMLKTLEFLNSRRPDLEIRANFIQQLRDYEQRLTRLGFGPKSASWNEFSSGPYPQVNPHGVFLVNGKDQDKDELLLRNTFLNAQMGPIAQLNDLAGVIKSQRLKWVDEATRNK